MIELVCSHRRGNKLVLCCVSSLEDGTAIAFQLDSEIVEVSGDDENHIFRDRQTAIETLRTSDWPHA